MIRYCQMYEEGEYRECGFLIGARCMANPENPFWIDSGFHNRIKIIGCQSWQRYIDYGERRERFGQEALNGITEGRPDTKGLPSGTEGRTERAGKTGPFLGPGALPELPVPEVGTGGLNHSGKTPVPVRFLQENRTAGRGNDKDNQPSGSNLTCVVCRKPAVASDQGWWYCIDCANKLGLIT